MRFVGRVGALILGLFGTIVALVVNFAYSGVHDALRLGGDKNISHSHGFIGFLLILVGFVGALLAVPAPAVAAVLLAIAAVGLFFIVKAYALFCSIFLLVAALLAYVDRTKKRPVAR